MVKDRLNDLRKGSKFKRNDDTSLQIIVSPEQEEILKALDRFAEIRSWIDGIKENVNDMKAIISEAAFHYNDKVIRSKMETRIKSSLSNCKQIHAAIKEIEEEIDEKDTRTIARIKRIQFLLIKDHYIKTYREHEEFLVQYDAKVKKIAQREAKIMSIQIQDDAEVENLLITQGNQCFVGNVLEETEKYRLQLRDLMARHNELESLEKSLIEVRDLFVKISTLVMEQGAMIQVVEYHAQQASMNVEEGAEQLEKARELKIKALKKKTCILIWVSVILFILVVILAFAP